MRFSLILVLQLVMMAGKAQPFNLPDSALFQHDLCFKRPALFSKGSVWRKAVQVPMALTALSLLSATDNESFDKYEFKELRDKVSPHFHHHADDYLQYAPVAAVYGLNLVGIKGRNDFANRTAIIVKSSVLVAAITLPLKKITAEPRPDTGERNSFPSGHTATAFAAATIIAKEYGHISKWYGIGAYTAATSVGVMRILNNRHWVTDTLAGAAVGILSTNVVYLTHQYKWGHRRRDDAQTLVFPSYNGRTGMVSLVHVFN